MPYCTVTTFKTLDEAIDMANDCEFGLSSSLHTNDMNVVLRTFNEIKFGETSVNRWNDEAMQGFHAGFRKSGIGGADGKHGLDEYLQTHVQWLVAPPSFKAGLSRVSPRPPTLPFA